MKKPERFLNVLFPLWMFWIIPTAWLIILPGNFILDSIIILVAVGRIAKGIDRKLFYKQSILKVWGFGFLADLAGSFLLLLPLTFPERGKLGHWWFERVANPISFNPFTSVFALIYVLLAIALSGFLIYFFNRRFSFKSVDLTDREKHKMALILALTTAPYAFLVPAQWLM